MSRTSWITLRIWLTKIWVCDRNRSMALRISSECSGSCRADQRNFPWLFPFKFELGPQSVPPPNVTHDLLGGNNPSPLFMDTSHVIRLFVSPSSSFDLLTPCRNWMDVPCQGCCTLVRGMLSLSSMLTAHRFCHCSYYGFWWLWPRQRHCSLVGGVLSSTFTAYGCRGCLLWVLGAVICCRNLLLTYCTPRLCDTFAFMTLAPLLSPSFFSSCQWSLQGMCTESLLWYGLRVLFPSVVLQGVCTGPPLFLFCPSLHSTSVRIHVIWLNQWLFNRLSPLTLEGPDPLPQCLLNKLKSIPSSILL